MPLYRVDISTLVSKYIGETEKNLDRVFARAAASGPVLLLDEADALLGRRTSVRDSHDRYADQGVGHLLARVDAYDGVVILAANREEGVDPELARRVRWTLSVGGG
ncbi:MAG: AAA family ATPase [Thermodesulfobacteriota bacterium]